MQHVPVSTTALSRMEELRTIQRALSDDLFHDEFVAHLVALIHPYKEDE